MCVVFVLNRMCSRCMSGPLDSENKPQNVQFLSQWPNRKMVHMCTLKRKWKSEVGGCMHTSGYSLECLIKYSAEMRHWKMSKFSGNVSRIHSFHSKLKLFFRPASNEWVWKCIVILSLWLFIEYLKPSDELPKIIKIRLWTTEVRINQYR